MNTINNAGAKTLTHFTVEFASPSDRLYANGRQQVQLRVGFEAADGNGGPIKITASDIINFVLVEDSSGREIQLKNPSAGASSPGTQWDWSNNRDSRYRFYPAEGALPEADASGSAGQTVFYRDFWVRSAASISLKIGAKITLRDGSEFTSKNMPSGAVTVVPVPVPSYRAADYTLKPTTISHSGVAYDYVPFVLRSRGRMIDFQSFSMSPTSVAVQAGTGDPTTKRAKLTGYTSEPGAGRISHSVKNPTLPGEVLSDFLRSGRPVIVVSSSYFDVREFPIPESNSAAQILAVDMYGNTHMRSIHFKNDHYQDREVSLF
jgi:hypothetical protein